MIDSANCSISDRVKAAHGKLQHLGPHRSCICCNLQRFGSLEAADIANSSIVGCVA